MSRAISTPPELPGFTAIEPLGSGGFADVFLYEQHAPRRKVAVKVLLADRLSAGSVDAFAAEADIMAQLSTHPAIVTIYQAGVSGDGRPFLVMEYCPRPNLQARYRTERFSVAESLRVGIQVSAAVETAHRAGILHRDIKPANILVTEYNRPALTDFGIAATTTSAAQSEGMSIPWSPPESFAEPPRGAETSDVWALGATVYTLLAGRSPFEVPGGSNSGADLISRIETGALASIDRADVPESLQRVLGRAMAKNPSSRYGSAIDLARALQRVQIELRQSVTPIDVVDEGGPDASVSAPDDEESTRIRSVVSIDPTGSGVGAPDIGTTNARSTTNARAATGAPPAPGAGAESLDQTVIRDANSLPRWGAAAPTPRAPGPAAGDDDATRMRAPITVSPGTPAPAPGFPGAPAAAGATATPDFAPPQPPQRPRRTAVIGWSIGGGLAGIALVVGGVFAVTSGLFSPGERPQDPAETPESTAVDVVIPGAGVPQVDELTATPVDGEIRVSWINPQPEDGDAYLWGIVRPGQESSFAVVNDTEIVIPAEPSGQTCVEVVLRREDGRSAADPAVVCTP